MDYEALAGELLLKMHALDNAKHHMNITDSMRGEMIVLRFIHMRGCPVRPGEISQAVSRTTARVAAALNSLEKKGLVTREIDESDRRQILVRLTSTGLAFVEARRAEVLKMTARFLSMLGEEDARSYVRITGRLPEIMARAINSIEGEDA